ncbi:MAG: zinc-dependent metalloprotease, partial [Alloprevotella sp.]|nr:zinc-dependent metalloprotease [Alloprevotella sp.]
AARKMKFGDELMGELIRFVSSHEVGHTLGLRHNFGSSSTVPTDSLRSRCFTEKYGHTPSIMDYARFNYVAQPEDSITTAGIFPRIGDYDLWAIKWGYTPMFDAYDIDSDHWELEKLVQAAELDKNPRLWFGDGETNRTNDPRCQTEDLGDDAVKSSDYGIKNLQRMMPNLPEWTYQSNDINLSGLKGVYDNVVSQFMRYTFHVANNIGGVMMTYKTIDETGDIYADTPREKQERALDFINRHVFTEPTWLIDVPYIHRLAPNPSTITERFGVNVTSRLFSATALETPTATYPLSDILSDVERMLFSELRSGKAVSPYRQALQRTYVGALTSYFTTAAPTKAARADVLYALRRLHKRLAAGGGANQATRSHFAALADLIDRALVIK